jgi:hypothetical protein
MHISLQKVVPNRYRPAMERLCLRLESFVLDGGLAPTPFTARIPPLWDRDPDERYFQSGTC